MEFAGGFHGQLTSIWHRMMGRPSNRRLEVFAENLFVASDADTLGPIVFQRGSGASEETIGASEVMAGFIEKILRERPWLEPIKARLAIPYAAEVATFIAALKGACEPYPEFAAGVSAQRMVEAAYESARSASAVPIRT
jgi:predicted dehydrogenase